jgi:non-specific serine/threonine protein kinase
MNAEAAADMARLIDNAHRAARIAVRLVPAGYDGEVVYLTALIQNLGRLLVQYHFPEEAGQIRRLMLPAESPGTGAKLSSGVKASEAASSKGPESGHAQQEEPGMSAEAASFAVLGVDIEELGFAVIKQWGLDESVQFIARRWPPSANVHPPVSDMEVLKTIASCANEMVDALSLPPARVQAALRQVFQRYGRPLGLTTRDIQEALQLEAHTPSAGAASPRPQAEMQPPTAKKDVSGADAQRKGATAA